MENKLYFEENCITIILNEIPEFQEKWNIHLIYWGKDPRSVGIDIAEFSHFTADNLKKKNIALIKRIFNLIELFLEKGEEKLKNHIYFQFIENLCNTFKYYTEKELRSYMGPLSQRALDKINAFWLEGELIESLD